MSERVNNDERLKGAYSAICGMNKNSLDIAKEENNKIVKEGKIKRSFMLNRKTIENLYELKYKIEPNKDLSSLVDEAIREYYNNRINQ